VSPLAIVEDTGAGPRRIEVVDATANTLTALLLAAVAMTLFFSTVCWVARSVRRRRTLAPRT
jgi:hypothetical protein